MARLPFASVGVDGCRGGWFYVGIAGDDAATFAVVASAAQIIARFDRRSPVFIDMPIGLADDGAVVRDCERLARERLGPRRSSVFAVPPRPVLACTAYAEANATSRELTGKGLSRQAFGLVPRIRELDDLLYTSAKARRMLREAHPELSFAALAGGVPMANAKKTDAGFRERLAVLESHYRFAEQVAGRAVLHLAGQGVGRDDILDAMANALVARAGRRRWRTLPSRPRTDSRGIAMRITYAEFP